MIGEATFDARQVAGNVIDELKEKYADKALTFEYMGDLEAWCHNLTYESFKRAAYNLMDNAARHSYTGGRIKVLCQIQGPMMVLSVRDYGPGMDRQTLEKAKEAFWRRESKYYDGTHGSGLGLAFVNRLAERTGGVLSLESERGKGTTATLIVGNQSSQSVQDVSKVRAA